MIIFLLGLVMFCPTLSSDVFAQTEPRPVHLEWTIGDPPEGGWTVGDHIPLQLSATYPASLQLNLPALPTTWGSFEVLDQTLLTPIGNADGTATVVRRATVTLWSPGHHQTPPLSIRYRDSSDELHEVVAPQISVDIVSVLDQGETKKQELKPQVSLPHPPVWPWILGGWMLISAVGVTGWFLLVRLRRRRAPALAPLPTFDRRPAHEIAYRELERIAFLNLPDQGEIKQHYTLIADCLRTYVQGRYHIAAMDQTTDELIAAMRHAKVDHGHARLFRELLAEADLVKFARFHPPVDHADAAIANARHIVDVTKTDDLSVRDIEASESGIRHHVSRAS